MGDLTRVAAPWLSHELSKLRRRFSHPQPRWNRCAETSSARLFKRSAEGYSSHSGSLSAVAGLLRSAHDTGAPSLASLTGCISSPPAGLFDSSAFDASLPNEQPRSPHRTQHG
jgi:hypothetical protein